MIIAPAYGRKYNSIDQAHQDWKDGKDFRIITGPLAGRYCSIRDIKSMGETYLLWKFGGRRLLLSE